MRDNLDPDSNVGDVNDPPTPRSRGCKILPINIFDKLVAMEHLVDIGLIRHVGTFALQLPHTNQIEIHFYVQQEAMIRFVEWRWNFPITSYSSFSRNKIGPWDVRFQEDRILKEITSGESDQTTAQVVFKFF
jgi:diketogulonate reductase-like aldo/keto reductase